MDVIAVGLGAAAGSLLRWGIVSPWPTGDPQLAATVIVNLLGTLLLGIVRRHPGLSDSRRAVLGAGMCGGLTTFSAIALTATEDLSGGATVALAVLVFASLPAHRLGQTIGARP